MIEWINSAIMAVADPALGWLLSLPKDLALAIVAVGTGAIITFARLFTTNQDLLRRCDRDKKRLKELTREARARKDKAAVQRHRATLHMIAMMTMKQEGLPLLLAILPLAVLGTWCFQRLAFTPPKAGEAIAVTVHLPESAVGDLAHIVPRAGIRDVSGPNGQSRWIQEVVSDVAPKTGKTVGGVAVWRIQADASPEPHTLEIRYKQASVETELSVGRRTYSPPVAFYPADSPIGCVQLDMRPVKLFGVVPGIGFLHLQPWLVAYFLIAIPSVTLLKRITGIH